MPRMTGFPFDVYNGKIRRNRGGRERARRTKTWIFFEKWGENLSVVGLVSRVGFMFISEVIMEG